MSKRMLLIIGLTLIFLLSACGNETDSTIEAELIDIKQTIEQYSLGNVDEDVALASVTSDALVITKDNDEQETYPLPEDEFFVSIAPYEEVTHPCINHSLTTCQGEMVEKEFDIFIEDAEGNIVVDETMTTLENGFIDLWLPKDTTFTVTVKHDGKMAESKISTYQGDNTCITTLQIA